MKQIIMNPHNLNDNEVLEKTKSRALLFNGNNKLLIIKYSNLYMLPGGKLEKGEAPKESLIREIEEELGTTMSEDSLEPFMTLTYYQKDFPTREGNVVNRKIITHYYTGFLDMDLNNKKTNLSEQEQKENFDANYINIDELEDILLKYQTTNPRNPYFVTELLTVLYEIK